MKGQTRGIVHVARPECDHGVSCPDALDVHGTPAVRNDLGELQQPFSGQRSARGHREGEFLTGNDLHRLRSDVATGREDQGEKGVPSSHEPVWIH